MTYTWPLGPDIPISQNFGSNPNNGVNPAGGHTGTDFAAPVGTTVRAIADGVVKYADWANKLPADYRADGSGPNPYWLNPSFGGIVVVIDHGPVVTVHAHLSETSLNAGDTVKQGQEIAKTGNTGAATTGPHLHFETLPDGWNFQNGTYGRVDPAQFCTAYWDPITTTAEGAATVATNQEKLDRTDATLLPGIAGVQSAGEIYTRILNIENIVKGLPTTAPAVTLTDAQVSAIAKQVAADLPATDEAAVAAAVVKALGTKLSA